MSKFAFISSRTVLVLLVIALCFAFGIKGYFKNSDARRVLSAIKQNAFDEAFGRTTDQMLKGEYGPEIFNQSYHSAAYQKYLLERWCDYGNEEFPKWTYIILVNGILEGKVDPVDIRNRINVLKLRAKQRATIDSSSTELERVNHIESMVSAKPD